MAFRRESSDRSSARGSRTFAGRDTNKRGSHRSERGSSGGYGKRSSRDFGGRNSDRRGSDRRGSDRPEMTKVTCDSCGKRCEVPFKPTSNKPIYCSDCFRKESSPRSSGSGSKDLAEINKKLDKIMDALDIN
ncbi:hypothetical protein HOI26_04415 [Candidatus Woesearchaeota archaeon]|nr:hypothetical protein [Candidatus Woesearchaeota archaeon]MBT5740315.1 hypothetical protein [Candidatus Woesearchaeota archaeon]